jgi:hypothetical protein
MVQWKYLTTLHGNGVVNGIGGSAKTLVYRKRVMSQEREDHSTTADL